MGRVASGRCVALPDVGKRAVELLDGGMTVDLVTTALVEETGEEFDVLDFVDALIGLGFVAEVDDGVVPSPQLPVPTFPGIRAVHVRWMLNPLVPLLVGLFVLAALAVIVSHPDVSLGYRELLWNERGTPVLILAAVAGWVLLFLHEFAHLAVARAAGVPARIRLGTRLQFLVMQTDVSGIELAPRRARITTYLAGMGSDLTVFAAAALFAAATAPSTVAHRILSAVSLLALLMLPFQLLVFLRTDLYFVLEDLVGCRDLHGDGLAYARHRFRRLCRALARRSAVRVDPVPGVPASERVAVRAYAVVLVLGTAGCLSFLALVTAPADVTLLAQAANAVTGGHSWTDRLDAAAVLALLGGGHLLWLMTWIRGRRVKKARS
ncbi:hypothetical protein [Streptomyces sp. NPDC048603]|uniref:hypothetical protein n=1 Tax=Streptomyces sp. NPDC048603 TaxID=3365577 RepID=UPI00371A43C2